MNWWKAHHGLPYDTKIGVIAKRISARRTDVLAVWICCLDFASQQPERGSVAGIDSAEIAFGLDLEISEIDRILEAFRDRGMIEGDTLAAWEKRQFTTTDETATERQRRRREREKPNKTSDVTADVTDVTRDIPKNTVTNAVTSVTSTVTCHGEQNRTEQRRTEQSRSEQTRARESIVPWKADAQYSRFATDYLSTGAALIDADFAAAYDSWQRLNLGQRLERVAALNRHFGEYSADPRFVPKPLKFLDTEWERPLRPAPVSIPRKDNLADRTMALVRRRIANGEPPL